MLRPLPPNLPPPSPDRILPRVIIAFLMLLLPLGAQPAPGAGDAIATLGTRTIRYGAFLDWLKANGSGQAGRTEALRQFLDLQVLAAKGRQLHLEHTRAFKSLLDALAAQRSAALVLEGSAGEKLRAEAGNPPEAEMQAYFQAHSDRFATPERFTARHILVRLKDGLGAHGKGLPEPEARARILHIQELLRSGRRFEELAATYSDDLATKASGGLYQDIPFGQFPEAFERAVRSQAIGQVGDPVETLFGYHLIRVEARLPEVPPDYGKAREAIRRQMFPGRLERLKEQFMEQTKRELGYRPAGAMVRVEWEQQRAQSLRDFSQDLSGSVDPPSPRWLGPMPR